MQDIIHYNYKNNHTLRETSALKSVNQFLIKYGHCTKREGSDFFNGQDPNNLLSDQYLMTIRTCKCFHSYISSIVVVCTQTGKVALLINNTNAYKYYKKNPCLLYDVNLSYFF